MKTLKRIRQIIAANINHLLEKAENPEKMIKQLILDMDESIISLRMEVAKAIAAEKRFGRKAEETEKSIRRWQEDSEQAVRDGKDDLARQAIGKKLDAERTLSEMNQQHEKAASVSETMKSELRQLENKIQEARRKKEILIARKHRAETQKAMLDTAQEFDRYAKRADSLLNDVGSYPPNAAESLEDAVLDLEAENEARRELMKVSPQIEEQFDEARRNETVEKALQEIKAKVKRGTKKT